MINTSPFYELVVNIVGIFNILMIVFRQVDLTDTTYSIKIWIYVQIVINFLFMIELISDFMSNGFFQSYQKHFRMTPETICQILNIYAVYEFIKQQEDSASTTELNEIVKFLELVIFVRMIKLLALFYEIRVTRIIVETIRNLLKPMLNLCSVLFVIFYIFAVLGMFLFGGKITKNNKLIQDNSSIPDNYHLLNFNDFPSAIMTMFPLMVVNNWMVIVDMYVSVYGES